MTSFGHFETYMAIDRIHLKKCWCQNSILSLHTDFGFNDNFRFQNENENENGRSA